MKTKKSEEIYNEYDKFIAELWTNIISNNIQNKIYLEGICPNDKSSLLVLKAAVDLSGLYGMTVYVKTNYINYKKLKRLIPNFKFSWKFFRIHNSAHSILNQILPSFNQSLDFTADIYTSFYEKGQI